MKIKLKDKYFVPYISCDEIDKAVAEVASKINNDYNNAQTEPIFVVLLSGAYMFAADLIKKITFPNDVTFIKVKSYDGIRSIGELNEILPLMVDIKDRDVIIVDDIADTGTTLNLLKKKYEKLSPKSIKLATLITKPNSLTCDLKVDYTGIIMKDSAFVVGYGLDYDEKGRTLNSIYILDEEN